ncbi:conserved Plasmodium protein, unknown function [Plasmodium yoelii]|uniref:Uncharacterized protein n=2 Tax=Plasmodium yoelii TaxID=5861 RepID=A0AAF0B5H0_PLAYO|nr:conserved Plasmodium protein, unknown function [Plasmodium yoelii]WBY58831.1 hypothetical protein Py17XNL_001105796 [Plasmodium yoelii yoelii]CDU19091.1 conserved Plasmodium protein, unknown function [Plasmodium yoelii]VTZ79676.1 conserved Plasmodium protein, unknown function [Plasmodium yoelii]|eukprot:XP_022812476.1 conserved Plasmodium protein, unknown function [Plasmodium yoelii]
MKKKNKINYYEEVYTYKNPEKYDEDVVDIDNNLLRVRGNSSILSRINIYSKEKKKKDNFKENRKRKYKKNDDGDKHNKKHSNHVITNLKSDIKYMDILICGDKNSGKTTFLNCISCVDHPNSTYNKSIDNYNEDNKNYNFQGVLNGKKEHTGNFSDKEKNIKENFMINNGRKEIISNYNKLELLSYIPIIYSKLSNRNYDVFLKKKQFKNNFLDTDVCEASIFITRDDLNFINYEFNIDNSFFHSDFDYININFCEFGEDLLRKIRVYYELFLLCNNEAREKKSENDILYDHKMVDNYIKGETNEYKQYFGSNNAISIIEGAILKIRETKYINYFINLKRSFFLVKSSFLIYNRLIKKTIKSYMKEKRHKLDDEIDTHIYRRKIDVVSNLLVKLCPDIYETKSPNKECKICKICKFCKILNRHNGEKLFNKFFLKKKKKNIFIMIDQEDMLNNFAYLNIIKNLNNYNKKDILFVGSRAFNFEKISKKFHIYFNLNHNLNIFNQILSKGSATADTIKIDIAPIYYLLKKFVNKNWKIQRRKRHIKNDRYNDIIFKYYSKEKIRKLCKKMHEGNTIEKEGSYTRHREILSNNNTNKLNVSFIKNNKKNKRLRYKLCEEYECNNNYGDKTDVQKELGYILLKEKKDTSNFFKNFYDEYIYKNKNVSYIKKLVKEGFDICFLFIKLCFYYKEYIEMKKKYEEDNKINIQNFVYLKQLEIIKKKECPFLYHNICVPSCIYVFINILKMNYQHNPLYSLKEYKMSSLLRFIFYGVIYYKFKKKSCDFFSNKNNKTNHICYFTPSVIINSIINLFEDKIRKEEELTYIYHDDNNKNRIKIDKTSSKLISPTLIRIRKNRNILKHIINNIDINIQPYIIISNIKQNWEYFKSYMIESNMCSYYDECAYIYPNVSFDIFLNFESLYDNEVNFSKLYNTNNGTYSFTLAFMPIQSSNSKRRNNFSDHNQVFHFPFTHKLLKYFNDNIALRIEKGNRNDYNSLYHVLCNNFFKMLKQLLIYYFKNGKRNLHKKKNKKIKINKIFLLLNYVMDIYYLMAYEENKMFVSKEKGFVVNNLHLPNTTNGQKKKIIFSIYPNNVLFNSIYFMWEEIKDKKNPLINKYLKYLERKLFFSIQCKN